MKFRHHTTQRFALRQPSGPFAARKWTRSRPLRLETLEDRRVPAIFTVTNTNDSGTGSLRQAILAANGGGLDEIHFDIPGAGAHTITPTSQLPFITDPVVIDGYTQPGAKANTNGPGLADNAVLQIEISGSILLSNGNGLVLGVTADGSAVRGLVIDQGFSRGIIVQASDVHIDGCFIGVDPTGTTAKGNGAGVFFDSGTDTSNGVVGGTTPDKRNVIAGNNPQIFIQSSTKHLIQGNLIGTDATGLVDLSAGGNGINIQASNDNVVGGSTPAERNVINGSTGISVGSSTGTKIQGNFIQVLIDGVTKAPPNLDGVFVDTTASNTLIGGLTSASGTGLGNVIGGHIGIQIGGSSNVVQGNLIGTDATGTKALGIDVDGVQLTGSSNTVGGTSADARNVISACGRAGITITSLGGPVSGTLIQGNFIGTDITGTPNSVGNGEGVFLEVASGNQILDNIIAGNAARGVDVGGGSNKNAIQGNSIFANGNLGIDLRGGTENGFGVTANDAGDADTGANNLQNVPVITSAITTAGNTTITGTLNSTPNSQFRLEFFANSVADPSGSGEGQLFLGFTNVTTDVNGDASFNVAFANTGGPGITATATDSDGNTSEFSAIVPLPPANTAPVIATLTGPLSAVRGQSLHYNGAFTDPDADVWTGTVHFGDGAGDQPLVLNADKSFAFDHVFTNLGKFTVVVTVADNHGGVGSDSLEVTINNVLPVITNFSGPLSGVRGQSLQYSGAFSDPDPDTWTATVNFGEGAGDEPLGLSAKTFAFDHIFAKTGNHTVAVTVTDNHGGVATASLVVNITDGAPPSFTDLVAVGAGTNGGSVVRVYDAAGTLLSTFQPYDPSFHGEVHTATGDINGDGVDDIVTGAGPGGGPHVQAFDGKSLLAGQVVHIAGPIGSFFAYTAAFRGGVYVAVGDVNGDGHPDIVTGAGPGGGPHVIAYDAVTRQIITTFYAYDPAFTGGVSVGAGDILGTGHAEIVTGAGPGGGPHVRVFDGDHVVKEFFAYHAAFHGGVYVAAGDVTGDGKADIVTGAGAGGGPHVKVYDGSTLACVRSFFAYESIFTGGVRVATANLDADANSEIIVGAGPLGGPHVRYVDNDINNTQLNSFYSPDKDFNGGVYVG